MSEKDERVIDTNILHPELHRDPGRVLREEVPRPSLHEVGDFHPRPPASPPVPRPVDNPPVGGKVQKLAVALPAPAGAAPPPEVFAGLFTQESGGYYLWSGVDWDGLVAKWRELAPDNLRLAGIDTTVDANGTTLFTGTWIESSADDFLYRTADLQVFLNLFAEKGKDGLWLADVHVDSAAGDRYYTGVWLGGSAKQKLVYDLGWDQLVDQWKRLSEQEGYRLIRLQAYPSYDTIHYLGVFEKGSGEYGLYAITNWDDFLAKVNEWKAMQLVDFGVLDDNGARWYRGVWRETSKAHTFVHGKGWSSFLDAWKTLGDKGQRLRIVRRYPATLQAIDPDWQGVFAGALGPSAEGYAWVVAKNGQVVSEGKAGTVRSPYQQPNGNVAWTLDSRINLASVSKPITTVGVIKLLNDRKISLDAPFYPYVKSKVPKVGAGVDKVTFRNLLTMKSGLKPDGTLYLSEPFWDFLSQYLQQGLVGTPGQTYAYSNTNFSILQGAIEEIFGQSYETYMKDEVLKKMGIDTAVFSPDPNSRDVATLSYAGSSDQRSGTYWSEMQMIGPGGWIAPASVLIKFLTGVRSNKVLSPELTKQMLTGELGWYTYDGNYGQYYHHNGGLTNGGSPAQGLNTGIIHFSDGYDALLLVNSPVPAIIPLMIRAFQTQK